MGYRILRPAYALRLVFRTRRGLRSFAANFLVAGGLVSGVVQFVAQLYFRTAFPAPVAVTIAAILGCLGWATARSYPRCRIVRKFRHPHTSVRIEVGDLFEQDAHLVVGFTDTFDTSVTDQRIISGTTVQAQLLRRRYGDDHHRLDQELAAALRRTAAVATERRADKPGKLTRYPIGTVAVLGKPGGHVFAVAYSRMGNDLVPRSSVKDVWISLHRLWTAVYERAERRPVAMPVIGSGLARIDQLDRETLLKLILISFLAGSRELPICQDLRIVISPADLHTVNLLEIAAFLRTL